MPTTEQVVAQATHAAVIRQIAAQIHRMTDEAVYRLTYSTHRTVARLALADAHRRAEAFAMRQEG